MLLLSEELKLDELQCLLCLLTAHDEVSCTGVTLANLLHHTLCLFGMSLTCALRPQRGEVAAEVAAGVYFEERRGLVATLHRLLQVLPGTEEGLDVADAVVDFNSDLLRLRSQGRSVLLTRLIELIAVSALALSCTA